MNERSQPRFSCPACGQRFDWREEYAGRTVTCKCGAKFQPGFGASELLQPRQPPPPEPARGPRPSSLPPRTTRPLREVASDDGESGPIVDWIIPVALIVVGGSLRVVQVLGFGAAAKLGTGRAMALWGCEVLLGTIAIFAAVAVAAQLLSTTFGHPGSVAVKVVGAWLTAASLAFFAANLDAEPNGLRGMVLAWHVVLVVYAVLFGWLFRLDLQETAVTAVVATVAQWAVLILVARVLSADAVRALFFG